MRLVRSVLLAAVLPHAGLSGAAAQQGAARLSSVPIDASLFREGEVRRLGGAFGRWSVVCDEIVRLQRRFCSLRTVVLDAAGRPLARLEVSTGDDGRPAALLHLPLGVVLSDGIEIDAGPAGPGKSAPGGGRRIPVAACTARECQAVWSLAARELQALTGGAGLVLRYRRIGNPALPVLRQQGAARPVVAGVVPAEGFAAAIQASLR